MFSAKSLCHLASQNVRYSSVRKQSDIAQKLKDLWHGKDMTAKLQIKTDLTRAKFEDLLQKYERFTGLTEVRIAQQMVLDAQEKFSKAQSLRRDLYKQLKTVQAKRKDILDKLQLTKPGEAKFLQLITDDHNVIGEEINLNKEFTDAEKLERELFTSLSTAVRISHEQERLQAEKTKYWSIIASVIGAILGIIGSSINNSHRMKEIKKILQEISSITENSSQTSSARLQAIESLLHDTYNSVASMTGSVAKYWTGNNNKRNRALAANSEINGTYFVLGLAAAMLMLCCCR